MIKSVRDLQVGDVIRKKSGVDVKGFGIPIFSDESCDWARKVKLTHSPILILEADVSIRYFSGRKFKVLADDQIVGYIWFHHEEDEFEVL
jgi:hypothetical protein